MTDSFSATESISGGMNIGNVSGDLSLRAGGDIVAGNKTIIQNIFPKSREKIIKAPYKFLSSYDISDKDIFFGRTKVIRILSEKISRHKIVVINGRSGSGKTSLINAGLIPQLANENYFFVSFKEYSDPVEQLRNYVLKNEYLNIDKKYLNDMSFLDMLTYLKLSQKIRILIIFDQFERFFVSVKEKARNAFINEIKKCIYSGLSSDDMNIVISLREDYFGILIREFETIMPDFFNESYRFHLHPLNREEATEAIMSPLIKQKFDLSYKKEFVETVLIPALMGEGSGEEKIDPPQLQIVCNQLYEEGKTFYAQNIKEEGSSKIDEALYNKLGKASGILRDYLDDFIDRAARKDLETKKSLRSMLKLMIESGGTRKFIFNSQLCQGLPDVTPDKITYYIKKLQDGRVIETRENDGLPTYSLSHEFMVEKVRSWFDEREMERKKSRETLDRGLAEWNSTRSLLSEKQVKKIQKWIQEELNDEEKELLNKSHEHHETRKLNEKMNEQRLQFRKKLIWGAFILILIVIILFFWAMYKSQKAELNTLKAEEKARLSDEQKKEEIKLRKIADKEREIAQKMRITSRSHELAGYAINTLDLDPVLSFRLAEAAYYITPTMQANKGIILPLTYPFYNHIRTTDIIHSVFFTPCGKKIIIQFEDHHIEIWDITKGTKIIEFEGYNIWIKHALLNNKLFVISMNNIIYTVDIVSGKINQIVNTNIYIKDKVAIRYVLPSHDGHYIAFKSEGKKFWIWDNEKQKIHILDKHLLDISNILFEPGDKYMISTDKRAIIWDTENWEIIRTFDKHNEMIQHIHIFKDNRIMTCDSNSEIKIWHLNDCMEIYGFTMDQNVVFTDMELSYNEKLLAVSFEKTALVWNLGQDIFQTKLNNPKKFQHSNHVYDIQFSIDNKYLITASDESTIWEIETNKVIYHLTGHTESIRQAIPSPSDNKIVVTSTLNDGIRIWNTDINALDTYRIFEEKLSSAEFAADDKYVIIKTVYPSNIYILLSDSLSLKEKVNNVKSFSLSLQKDYLTIYTRDGNFICIKLKPYEHGYFDRINTDAKDYSLSPNGEILYVSSNTYNSVFSQDNSMLLSVSIDTHIPKIIDVTTNEQICRLSACNNAMFCKTIFSPKDNYILTLIDEDAYKNLFFEKNERVQLRLWETGNCFNFFSPIIKTEEQIVNNAYFSPDESLLVTTTSDKGYVFDIKTHRLKYFITEHKNSIKNVSFSSDNKYMITISDSEINQNDFELKDSQKSHLIIWDLKTGMSVFNFSEKKTINSASLSKDSSNILICSDKVVSIRTIDPKLALDHINNKKRGIVRELTPQEIKRYAFSHDDLKKLSKKILSHHQNDIDVYFQWVVVFILHQMEDDADLLFKTILQQFSEHKEKILEQFILTQKMNNTRDINTFLNERSTDVRGL